jgi:hypothetical protein
MEGYRGKREGSSILRFRGYTILPRKRSDEAKKVRN